ncbi:nitrous oxide reductase family maturation protein NosD [Armatimonadetes bacterium DC]|nr:nitrous oxide reductase family maturation protein NosD [Armatimonadetes bacterium DC]
MTRTQVFDCPGEGLNKVMLLLASLLVVASIFLPYWRIEIVAPQYPEGLYVYIHVTGAQGDVREVDGLNHYIGMRPLGEAAPFERKISIPGLSLIALALLASVFVRRPRWLQVMLILPVLAVLVVFPADLYYWLREFGLNLDPKAPLSAMVKPFVPPLVGPGKIAQFGVVSWPWLGYALVVVASVLAVWATARRVRCERVLAGYQASMPGRAAAGVASLGLLLVSLAPLHAREWVVASGGTLSLSEALQRAQAGDTIRVVGGIHHGHWVVEKPLYLLGEHAPILDGGGVGTVLTLKAPHSVVRGFVIRNSGTVLNSQDSGIHVEAPDCIVEDNRIERVLFGVHLDYAHRTVVRRNMIFSHDLPIARRGDQIRIWYSHHAIVEQNTVVGGRDLVFWYSEGVQIRNNVVRQSRYGVHFMYCSNSVVEGNILENNSVGVYIMYSDGVRVAKNQIRANRGPSGMGLGIKDGYGLQVEQNLIADNRMGIFVDSGEGVYRGNWLIRNDVGVYLHLAVKTNRFEENAFIENWEQVSLERPHSVSGVSWRGNYWSDYSGYDADGDGTGDVAYQAVKVFDLLASQNAALRLLTYSPSAQALDFGARVFPLFAPRPLVRDEAPRMRPLPPPYTSKRVASRQGWLLFASLTLTLGVLGVARPRVQAFRKQKERTGKRVMAVQLAGAVIKVSNLTRRFGNVRAVDSVSFVVREGETVALWGANGAGKTTILRCLLGLLRFEGEARVLGYAADRESLAVRQQVGYVPQLIHLHPDQTVLETMHFYARLRGVAAERVETLLREWELEPHVEKPVHALSGGLKQKLALALALLSDPPILLLDEPTAHLDTAARAEWLELLRRLKAEGKTLVFCTHQFAEVRALADRVIVLEYGKKVADLTGRDFAQLWLQRGSLRLLVPPSDSERAQQLLREAGYSVEAFDGMVVVHHLPAKRVDPLKLLLDSGIEVLDYEWRAPVESPDWSQIPETMRFAGEASADEVPRMKNSLALPSLLEKVRLLAVKEIRDSRRNRWFLLLAGIFTVLSVILTAFGLTGTGESGGVAGFGRTFASLLNLSLLIVPLIGLILGAMSVASERDQQTLYTLLSHPISPTDLIWGKFLGGMVLLGSAVLVGFGSSGLLLFMSGADMPVGQFAGQMGLTLLLGWVCLALGMGVSTLVKRGATAVGIALLMWLALVFISDLGIIGTAIALQLKAQTLLWLTFLNPLQVFKIAVIQLMEGNLEVLGSAGLYARDRFGDGVLWVGVGALLAWLAVPLLIAWTWFAKRGARE